MITTLHVADVADALEHALGRTEEQGALESEQGDALVTGLGGRGQLFTMHPARSRQGTEREERGDRDADEHRVDEVEAHRDDGRDDEHDGVGASRAEHRAHRRERDHAGSGDHEHAGERGERDLGDDGAADEHDHEQQQRVHDRREACAPPERTFTAVRAIAPVAGMPPKNPAATEASP